MRNIRSFALAVLLVLPAVSFAFADAAMPPEPEKGGAGLIIGAIAAAVAVILAVIRRFKKK